MSDTIIGAWLSKKVNVDKPFYSYILFLLLLLLLIQKSISRGHQERYKAFPSIKIWRTSFKIKLELFKPENAGKWPLTKSLVTRTDYSSPLTNVIFSGLNWFKLNAWHDSAPPPRKTVGNSCSAREVKKKTLYFSFYSFSFFLSCIRCWFLQLLIWKLKLGALRSRNFRRKTI